MLMYQLLDAEQIKLLAQDRNNTSNRQRYQEQIMISLLGYMSNQIGGKSNIDYNHLKGMVDRIVVPPTGS